MPIQSNSPLNWSDIQDIYTNLRLTQEEFVLVQTPIPSYANSLALNTHLSDLVKQIEALQSQPKIGNQAITGVTAPNKGELITPIGFRRVADVAETLAGICNFDSSFNSNNNGFDFRASFNSNNNGFDFRAGFDSSDDGFDFDSGFDSSDDGFDFDSGFDSSNDGFNSNNNGFSFRSSFNSGNNGFGFDRQFTRTSDFLF